MHRQSVIQWARTGIENSGSGLPGSIPSFRPFPGDHDPLGALSSGLSSGRTASGLSGYPQPTTSPRELAPWEQEIAPVVSIHSDAGADEASGPQAMGPQAMDLRLDASHHDGAPAPLSYASSLGFQVHNRYLVTQDEAGMVVIDQHALHERVMYERIREKVITSDGQLETQRMLVPEPVSLTPAERCAALDSRELLMRIGIEIDDFGGDTILISGYPAMLGKTPPGELLRQALESIISAGKQPEARDILDSLLHSIACKAAIKAGDRLTPEEITSLLEQRELYQDTHHCPHGRPTALFFSRDELDRMFGRLGPRSRAMKS